MLDGIHLVGVDADQVVRELRQVLRVKAIGAELLKQGVVPCFAVQAVDLELRDGDGLGQSNQLWPALAIRRQCVGTAVELKSVGFGS